MNPLYQALGFNLLEDQFQKKENSVKQKTSKEQKKLNAKKIQNSWKRNSIKIEAEQAKHLLSCTLFKKAKPYIDHPLSLKNLPRANHGKTKVYLPKNLPIVLKQSGSPENLKRFNQMQQGRDICEKSEYTHLVIPEARVYTDFLIESRLPITMDGTKEQIGLYIENREQFTCALTSSPA